MTLLRRSHSPISLVSSLFCDLFLPDPDLTLLINDFSSVTLARSIESLVGWVDEGLEELEVGGRGEEIFVPHTWANTNSQLVGPALGSNSPSLSFFLV